MLVLEDLDSLLGMLCVIAYPQQCALIVLANEIEAKNRAFFLNELDGFQSVSFNYLFTKGLMFKRIFGSHQNDGILILASSNHPEKIDPAIISRPSRFDVRLLFQPFAEQAGSYLF